METIRAFVAIPLPPSLLDRLSILQRQLEKQVPPQSVRWVRGEGIHLTLKFLGDTPVEKLPFIKRALAAEAQHVPPFSFTAAGLGCFPRSRRPRVIWVGVEEPLGRLATLQSGIEEAMSGLGFKPEHRKFHPHLTLGRVQQRVSRRDRERIGEVITAAPVEVLAEVPADRFALIRSVLKPSGAEYTTLEEFTLGGGE